MYLAEISEVTQNIIHYLVPVHMSESSYPITCCSYHFVSQVSKTGAKLCAWTTKAEVNYSPKPLSSKKGKIKLEKTPSIRSFCIGKNGKEGFCSNAASTYNPTETDFQISVLKFQHF